MVGCGSSSTTTKPADRTVCHDFAQVLASLNNKALPADETVTQVSSRLLQAVKDGANASPDVRVGLSDVVVAVRSKSAGSNLAQALQPLATACDARFPGGV